MRAKTAEGDFTPDQRIEQLQLGWIGRTVGRVDGRAVMRKDEIQPVEIHFVGEIVDQCSARTDAAGVTGAGENLLQAGVNGSCRLPDGERFDVRACGKDVIEIGCRDAPANADPVSDVYPAASEIAGGREDDPARAVLDGKVAVRDATGGQGGGHEVKGRVDGFASQRFRQARRRCYDSQYDGNDRHSDKIIAKVPCARLPSCEGIEIFATNG